MPPKGKGALFNQLIVLGMATPQGAKLVRDNSNLLVDTNSGVTTLKEKETQSDK